MVVLLPRLIKMPSIEMKSEKTLLFGGTFDPVHKGHLYLLRMAEEHTDYNRVIIVPAYISNFKQGTHPASGADRMAMLSIAIKEYYELYKESRLEIILSDIELNREGVSYTYDTVVSILKEYPIEGRLGFLMGDDLLEGLDRWYRFDDLKHLVTFVCFTRGFHEAESETDADISYIPIEAYHSSSTEIREGKFGNLTKGVYEYVVSHGLYKTL